MDKRMSMQEAISRNVSDGNVVYLAGFTHLMPFAAAHEIIRQGRRHLTLCRATPDVIYEQMLAAGCSKKLVFSFAGNPGVGPLRVMRKMVEAHELEIEEYSHFGMTARLFAGAAKLPFMMLRTYAGSDLPKYNCSIKTIRCPYSGEELYTVPALNPDVAIIHAQRADSEGNTHIWGVVGEQKEAAFASSRVIVIAEEIVKESVIRSDPNRTMIPGFIVGAVVQEPWGAHPSYAQGYYDRDNEFFLEWDQITQDEKAVQRYLSEWVYGVKDRHEYLSKLSADRLVRLRGHTHYSTPVDYGFYP